ncbi:MAG TPA: FtsW/RodA/SpoVE family cell cycle protein [Planctomycetota bacterium]|nr:FtsW/RodA/SpoVE family cell cycle protein [Planctomycetota bacterium]
MIPRFNKTILACVILLSGMGLLSLWTQAPSTNLAGQSITQSIFLKQLTFLGISLVTMVLVAWPNYLNYRHLAFVLYVVLLGLLALLLVKGSYVNGARCWFDFKVVKFQPAEFMKIALVLVLANVLMYGRDLHTWRGLLLPIALTAAPAALIVVQPDMGTTILLVPTLFAMLFAAGARKRHLAIIVLLLLAAAPVVWFAGMKDYQRMRILSFLTGGGYQVGQSIKACTAGGGFGRGMGESGAASPYFIPERHTDFVFSIIAEDLGFAGSSFVLLLIAIYFSTSLKIAHDSREPFGRLIVVGLTTLFATQTFINIGMTLGVAPITGLTLPFVSYGGSSLVACSISAGLILNVAARWQPGFSSRDMAGGSVEIRDLQPRSVVGVGQ